jgi:hypothetical protein
VRPGVGGQARSARHSGQASNGRDEYGKQG